MIAVIVGSEDLRRRSIPVALARAGFDAREILATDTTAAHRMVLESPLDAAAVVVAAVRQAMSNRRLPARPARQPLREAG